VGGVTFDGTNVWFAAGDRLVAFDPESGDGAHPRRRGPCRHRLRRPHLYQIAEDRIQKHRSGDRARGGDHSRARRRRRFRPRLGGRLLWVGQYRDRRIIQVDPETGKVLRTIESNRFVTGVTWVDGELWHGTWEDEDSDIRRIDPETGAVLEVVAMPEGTGVSGLESDGGDRFFCGGGKSGVIRAVRRPPRKA
jgi:hypothetical protein